MPSRYSSIQEILTAYGRRDTLRRLSEGALALALFVGLAAALLAGVDLAARPDAPVRLGLLFGALAALAAVALALALRAWLAPGAGRVAVAIEAQSPSNFANTLVTAVDCEDPDIARKFGYSPQLIEACRKQALTIADGVDVGRLPPFGQAGRLAIAAAALACLWVAIGAWQGERVRDVLRYRYLALLAPAAAGPVTLDVKPGDQTVLEGARLEVRAAITGRAFSAEEPPVLKRHVDGAVREESIALAPAVDEGAWVTLFPAVMKPFRYRVEAGPFESREFSVRVVPPPRIAALTLSYRYPAYTGIKDHVQDRPPYDVSAPIGTKVTVDVVASKPLKSAQLLLPGKPAALKAGAAPTKWTGEFEVAQSGQYSVEIHDTDGFTNPSPDRYQILAVSDRVPRVLVLEPGRDLSVKPQELTTLALKLDVSDDYGLRRIVLKAKLTQKVEYDYMSSDEEHVIAEPKNAPQKLALDWSWDLSKRVLQPGDQISYFVEAADHLPKDGKPDPAHVGVSKTFTIRVPFQAEVMSKVGEDEEQQIGSVEEIAQRQKALDERVDKVLKDIRNQREVGYKERKELESLVQKQKEIKDKAQDVSNRMKDTLDTLKKNDLVDPGTVKKLSEIQQLFHEVADSKMKENMERLKDMMQGMKMDPDKMQRMMQEFDKKKYSDQLERILKSLKRMKQQQELSRAVKKMDEMIKEQEELRQETAAREQKKQDTSELAKRQEELKREMEQLMKQMPKLSEALAQEFKENEEDAQKLAQESKNQDATPEMEQASQDLKKNEGQKAYQQQSAALKKMQKMRQEMKDVQEKVREKQQQVDLQALIALVGHGMRVSGLQETVYADASASTNSPDLVRRFCLELAGRQYVALRGTHRFEKDFGEAFSDDVAFKNMFLQQIGQLVDDMAEAKKNYEDGRLFSAKQLSERSLSRLNVILVKLLDAMNQLQDQQQSDSMQSFFDQMQKMTESQRKLNEKTQRLKPGEQQSQFMQQMMQQMAAEQEMIRQAMQEMAGKYDQAKQLLGDLDKLGKDMKEVEDALRKFDRTAEVKDKQNKILDKMLDLERSIHKKGKSEKREAEQAKTFEPVKAAPLSQDLLEVKQKLHENLSRESYPPQHKKIVEDYFSSFGP